ncbi:MAG: flavodoxin-dependent (E)-4-hydroxy-3-methylbut-2-enyl-diphosphate synthase [Nitrospirae bacterium]|nr:flavodoxin-dependent (E)-4-hydroxy-3-methylbut-2-enyl-diphosphate synthase [Nitrospirota bacterium]
MERRKTRRITVGGVAIGGDAPIAVQSMTTTDTRDVAATIEQIKRLELAGCEVVRVAVVDEEAAEALKPIKAGISIPLIADIHYNYRLALRSAPYVDCIRINPGNIGGRDRVAQVVSACKDRGIPIRIGVNAGSLEEDLLKKYGYPTPEAMVESALRAIGMLEEMDFREMKLSLKASHVGLCIEAYRLISNKTDYPLHLGITEAGTAFAGSIKSAVGMGILLSEGIGDTIRISLAADPVEEVKAGFEILKALELRHRGINFIACPTCGRLEFEMFKLMAELERRLSHIKTPLNVSILGCAVNGIGEGMEADIGIAGGKEGGLLFKRGKIVGKVKESEMADVLVAEVEAMAKEREKEK